MVDTTLHRLDYSIAFPILVHQLCLWIWIKSGWIEYDLKWRPMELLSGMESMIAFTETVSWLWYEYIVLASPLLNLRFVWAGFDWLSRKITLPFTHDFGWINWCSVCGVYRGEYVCLKYHILCLCVSVHLFLCEGIALLVKTVEGVMSDEARDMIMRVHQMIQIQKTLQTVMNQMTKR